MILPAYLAARPACLLLLHGINSSLPWMGWLLLCLSLSSSSHSSAQLNACRNLLMEQLHLFFSFFFPSGRRFILCVWGYDLNGCVTVSRMGSLQKHVFGTCWTKPWLVSLLIFFRSWGRGPLYKLPPLGPSPCPALFQPSGSDSTFAAPHNSHSECSRTAAPAPSAAAAAAPVPPPCNKPLPRLERRRQQQHHVVSVGGGDVARAR